MAKHISWHKYILAGAQNEYLVSRVESLDFSAILDIIKSNHLSHTVDIKTSMQKTRWALAKWIKENLQGEFTHLPYKVKEADSDIVSFLFNNIEDAVRFKLVWG
jgi:hypothetical protein